MGSCRVLTLIVAKDRRAKIPCEWRAKFTFRLLGAMAQVDGSLKIKPTEKSMLKAKTAHIQGVKLSTAAVMLMAPGVYNVNTMRRQAH